MNNKKKKNGLFDLIEKNKLISFFFVLLLLAVILYPRFNMQDTAIIRPFTGVAPGQMTPDQKNYYNFTEYFRGNQELSSVWAPFSYRPLMPFLAAQLPFDAMLSMSIVNTIANLLTLVLIYLTLKKLQFRFALRIAGLFLYIFSFPLLYYGSSGFLEPTSNFFIYLIVYLVVGGHVFLLVPAFILASMTKEVTIVVLPFALIYYWLEYKNNGTELKKSMLILAISAIMFIVTNLFVRHYFETGNNYFWAPTIDTAIGNLKRAKTYLSFLLGFGLPGLLSLLYLIKYKSNIFDKKVLPWITGMLFAILLSFYSVIAAYSDGRFIWTGYPFMIVLAIYYLQQKFDRSTVQ